MGNIRKVKTDTLFSSEDWYFVSSCTIDTGATACIYINKCNLQIDKSKYTLKTRLLSHY